MITVAITGSVPRKKDTPAVPVTPAEQVESTHEAYEAGATVVHIHVRDAEENASSDPELFAQVQAGVTKHCPGMVVQFSTGGRGRDHEQRKRPLSLVPEMASFATGSVKDRKSVVKGKSVSVRVDLGGRRLLKKKKQRKQITIK